MPLKLAINGALGRMGRAIARLAADAGHTVVAPIDVSHIGESYGTCVGDTRHGTAVVKGYTGGADVLIDFSLPAALEARLEECVRHGTALVSGTTGLASAHHALMDQAAAHIPVLHAPNMSLGVNLLLGLARQAAAALPASYAIEIVEMHHQHKVDAPSGTALALLDAVCSGNGRDPRQVARHGREGVTGARTEREIGIHALRGGDVIGDHTIYFVADGERIELTHRASNRDTFAAGALRAAEWVHSRPAGRFAMAQVLGLG